MFDAGSRMTSQMFGPKTFLTPGPDWLRRCSVQKPVWRGVPNNLFDVKICQVSLTISHGKMHSTEIEEHCGWELCWNVTGRPQSVGRPHRQIVPQEIHCQNNGSVTLGGANLKEAIKHRQVQAENHPVQTFQRQIIVVTGNIGAVGHSIPVRPNPSLL